MADDRRQPYQGASPRSGSEGRQSGYVRDKRGLNTKIHLAVDAYGMPVRFFIISGTTADCTIAAQLIEGFPAEYLLADRGYDTDAIILKAVDEGMTPVIPPRKNRKLLREYDESLCKLRHRVVNAFLLLKRRRGIAARCAKNAASFAAAVQIRCIVIKNNTNKSQDAFPNRGNRQNRNLDELNAVLYVVENGCGWRSLPKEYGAWLYTGCSAQKAAAKILGTMIRGLKQL